MVVRDSWSIGERVETLSPYTLCFRKVPNLLREKAVEYFAYVWAHGGAQVDEDEIAEFLPPRLFGEIAVEIHMDTLKKVKLFEVVL